MPKFSVEGQLQQLGLIVPFDAAAVADDAHYLVHPPEFGHSKPLELVRAWLLEQASAYSASQEQR